MAEAGYLHLRSQVEQGFLVMTITSAQVEGEEVAERLRDEMLDALAASGCQHVVIDFQHTRYISSVAFRPLLSLRKKLNESGGRAILCGLSPVVGDVFYTTRMVNSSGNFTAPFEIEADVPAAISRLKTTQGGTRGQP